MKVIAFVPSYNTEHEMVLRAMAEGIPGCQVRPVDKYEGCDVAIIYGIVKRAYQATWTKREIMSRHTAPRSLIVVESAYVRRGEYWNVGFNGINNNADFRNQGVPDDRWRALQVAGRPWRPYTQDGPIVVCGQVPWDTNVQDTDHKGWCAKTFKYLFEAHPNRRVIFRPHPRLVKAWRQHYPGIDERFIDKRPLELTLREAHCFVTWNSNSGVDAAIAGVPVIALDKGSGAWDVANHDLLAVANPATPPRLEWMARLGYAQWNLAEMKAGLPWKHLMREEPVS